MTATGELNSPKLACLFHTAHTHDTLRAPNYLIKLDSHWTDLGTGTALCASILHQFKLHNGDLVKEAVKRTHWTCRIAKGSGGDNTPPYEYQHPQQFIIEQQAQGRPELWLQEEHGDSSFQCSCRTHVLAKPRFPHAPLIGEQEREEKDKEDEHEIFYISQWIDYFPFFTQGQLVEEFLDQAKGTEPSAGYSAAECPDKTDGANDI